METIVFNSVITAVLSIAVLVLAWRVRHLERIVKEQDEDICTTVDTCVDNVLIVYVNQLLMARDNAARKEQFEDAAKFDKLAKETLKAIKGHVDITTFKEKSYQEEQEEDED